MREMEQAQLQRAAAAAQERQRAESRAHKAQEAAEMQRWSDALMNEARQQELRCVRLRMDKMRHAVHHPALLQRCF